MLLWDKLVITAAISFFLIGFSVVILLPLLERYDKKIPWWVYPLLIPIAFILSITFVVSVIILIVIKIKSMVG